jgi:hypothetical protein
VQIESTVPFIKAVESVIGHRPHLQTCRRWIKKGVRGIKLEAVFAGGEYRTTEDAVREFIHATTQARLECPEPAKIDRVKPVVAGRVKSAVEQFAKLPKSARKASLSR